MSEKEFIAYCLMSGEGWLMYCPNHGPNRFVCVCWEDLGTIEEGSINYDYGWTKTFRNGTWGEWTPHD